MGATDDPELDPTTRTRAIELQEVPNNHLSPMGAIDEFGNFSRSLGRERLTRYVRGGIFVSGIFLTIVVAAELLG